MKPARKPPCQPRPKNLGSIGQGASCGLLHMCNNTKPWHRRMCNRGILRSGLVDLIVQTRNTKYEIRRMRRHQASSVVNCTLVPFVNLPKLHVSFRNPHTCIQKASSKHLFSVIRSRLPFPRTPRQISWSRHSSPISKSCLGTKTGTESLSRLAFAQPQSLDWHHDDHCGVNLEQKVGSSTFILIPSIGSDFIHESFGVTTVTCYQGILTPIPCAFLFFILHLTLSWSSICGLFDRNSQ